MATMINAEMAALGNSLKSEQAGCIDVLMQASAVLGAVHCLLMAVLDEHLREHVVGPANPAERAAEAQILVTLLGAYGK